MQVVSFFCFTLSEMHRKQLSMRVCVRVCVCVCVSVSVKAAQIAEIPLSQGRGWWGYQQVDSYKHLRETIPVFYFTAKKTSTWCEK